MKRVTAPPHRVRVVLADLSPLLRDIIGEIVTSEADMTVVAELPDTARLLSVIPERGAEVVIMRCDSTASPGLIKEMLGLAPRLKVICLETDRYEATLHELKPGSTRFPNPSVNNLIGAIRAAW